jgi:3'(2'), 5'-bisphosphate nucleotidase
MMKQMLDLAIKAAIRGAKEILDVYHKDFEVEFKSDKSPLTLADQKSHEAINAVLSGSSYPVLSEEGRDIHYQVRKSWKRFWLVDPLDGTKEFVKRNGEFTVNIALIENNRPVLGIILVPVTGKLYYAAVGIGAYVTHLSALDEAFMSRIEGQSMLLCAFSKEDIYRVVCSRSHMSPETSAYIESIRPSHPDMDFVSIGSSLKLCLVAEGSADLYPRFGPTMEWDTAAGQAIIEISGGFVHEVSSGQPMRYNKENLLNPWFIAGRK